MGCFVHQIVPILALGGKGVISVLSNICPKLAHDIPTLYLEGKVKESAKLQLEYLDLINDEVAKAQLGTLLPVGDQLLGQTEVMFSLSQLVPLIASVGNKGEDYVFTLDVTDEAGNNLVKDVVFYNPAE